MMNDCTLALLMMGVLALIGVSILANSRENIAAKAFMKTLAKSESDVVLRMQPWGGKYQLQQINGTIFGWHPLIILLLPDEIRLYPIQPDMGSSDTIKADEVRWFGRPKKYNRLRMNELWMYYERKDGWYLVKVRLQYEQMLDFVRGLKQILPDELVTAYRRRRPYIHYGPVEAFPAEQDMYGIWELQPPVDVLITPLHLVFLRGQHVLNLISLKDIQHIRALQRVDEHDARGLVRFEVGETVTAFAVLHYEEVAELLATAAKRTLEEPVQRKRKKHDDEPEDEEELFEEEFSGTF